MKTTNMQFALIPLSLSLILTVFNASVRANSPSSIIVKNDSGEKVTVWAQSTLKKVFEQPLHIAKNRTSPLFFRFPGKYKVIVQDSHGRKFDCGLHDLYQAVLQASASGTSAYLSLKKYFPYGYRHSQFKLSIERTQRRDRTPFYRAR